MTIDRFQITKQSDERADYLVTNETTHASIAVVQIDDGWELLGLIRETRPPYYSYEEPIGFCQTLTEAIDLARSNLGTDYGY
jgi:hypothetical protein